MADDPFLHAALSPSDLVAVWGLFDAHDPPLDRDTACFRWTGTGWEVFSHSPAGEVIAHLDVTEGAWVTGDHE